MGGVEDNQMIEAFTPDRADQPFGVPVLPGRMDLRGPVANAQGPEPLAEDGAIRSIVVPHQKARCRIPGKGFGDLLGQPLRGGLRCYLDMQDVPSVVSEHNEDVEPFEPQRGGRKHVDGRDLVGMVAQKA